METYRNILVCVVGKSPQIITESLYYLKVQQKHIISEIHLLTTTVGREITESMLLNNGAGAFFDFCRAYGFNATDMYPKFHIINGENGQPLDDIRTRADNEATANAFLAVLRSLTQSDADRLFTSIAGGRKTMSAYLMVVMQLLGRPQDRLFHVLVSPDSIENNPAFFFPKDTVDAMDFKDKHGNPFSVPRKDIRIDMAEIPYVRLSRIRQPDIAFAETSFSAIIKRAQRDWESAIIPPQLTIAVMDRKLLVNSADNFHAEINLSPLEMVFYHFFVQKGGFLNSYSHLDRVKSHIDTFYKTYFAHASYLGGNLKPERVREVRANINKKIVRQIPDNLINDFILVQSVWESNAGGKPEHKGKKFYIKLPHDRIKVLQ